MRRKRTVCDANSEKHYSGGGQPRCYGDVERRQATLKAGMRLVWDSGFLCYYAEPWCYGCQVVYSRDNTADCSHLGQVGQCAWTALDDIQSWVDYVFFAVQQNLTLDGGWSPCRSLVVTWQPKVTSYCKAEPGTKDLYVQPMDPWKDPPEVSTYYKAEPGAKDLAIVPTSVCLYDGDLLNTQSSHLQAMHSLFMRLCRRRYYFKRMSWQQQKRREFLEFLKSEEVLLEEALRNYKTWRLLLVEMT